MTSYLNYTSYSMISSIAVRLYLAVGIRMGKPRNHTLQRTIGTESNFIPFSPFYEHFSCRPCLLPPLWLLFLKAGFGKCLSEEATKVFKILWHLLSSSSCQFSFSLPGVKLLSKKGVISGSSTTKVFKNYKTF